MPKDTEQPTKEELKDAHQSDTLDLLRKIIGSVQLSEITALDNLPTADRLNFLKFCSETYSNPYFEMIITNLYLPHIMAAATKAENYDIVTFNRATANGISLVREFFKKQEIRFREEFEKESGGNKGFQEDKPFDESEADVFFKP